MLSALFDALDQWKNTIATYHVVGRSRFVINIVCVLRGGGGELERRELNFFIGCKFACVMSTFYLCGTFTVRKYLTCFVCVLD